MSATMPTTGSPPITIASLEQLLAIARGAGEAILRHYTAQIQSQAKADGSPLTAADRAAHEFIDSALRAWCPSVPIISEEGDVAPYDTRRDWTHFWLVDPLDGTKEFLARNGEFTVNIALVAHGVPVLGVVHAPALSRSWYGGDGLGSWSATADAPPVRIWSSAAPPGAACRIVESRSHPSERLERYLESIAVQERVQAGSSLKFCLVAEGRADLYPRFGPTMEWDVAAGDCIVRNSGRDGPRRSPLAYNTPELRVGDFVMGV